MKKLGVAVLEDNKLLLKGLVQMLSKSGVVEVVAYEVNSESFLEKLKHTRAEALVLDIDIAGDNMNGIEVANYAGLPVLFVSGKTKEYLKEIEEVDLESDTIIEFITKPVNQNKLNRKLEKFIDQVQSFQRNQSVYLKFEGGNTEKVSKKDIVFLEADKQHGAKSNNKRIYFSNKKPQTLIDFSFNQMDRIGLFKTQFITIHKSFRVNASQIKDYNVKKHTLLVKAKDENGDLRDFELRVTNNYKKNVEQQLK